MDLVESIGKRDHVVGGAFFELLRVVLELYEVVEISRTFLLGCKALQNLDQRSGRQDTIFLDDILF